MKNNDINKRYYYIYIFIMGICAIMCLRILYLGIVEGQNYKAIAQNSIYKDITIPSPRGEIRDRNGILLAGNKPIFTVKIAKNEIESGVLTNKQRKQKINKVSKTLSDLLIKNNEVIDDSFPITITNGTFSFTFDEDIQKWKKDNNIDAKKTAKESFYQVANNFSKSSGIKISKDDSPFDIQKTLNDNGVYPPISVTGDMAFTKDLDKKAWLGSYNIRDDEISAKSAFNKIRENRLIDSSLSDKDARAILVIVNSMLSKKYLQYEPTLISKDISQKTVAAINENIVNLSGVSVQVEPLRYYPQGNLASHILGQIGKISSNDEHYLQDSRYSKSDYVGKSGIELMYEKHLKGTNGYERVLVDSVGKKIKDIESKQGFAGNSINLSIDAKLQKVAEDSLEKTLKKLQVGGVYDSKWGNYNMTGSRSYNNANVGAIVAVEIDTGKVLALASYPSYDPNIFTSGLTKEQLKSLEPANPNDPLSPKPMFNAATMTAVQPGSIFKMVSAMAALENGLSPNYTIPDKGFIKLGSQTFGNWLWNESRLTQGLENVITALRDSNNYFFYCISVAYNYATGQNIPMGDMQNGQKILDMAKKFGLDQKSGVEIYELSGKIPNEQTKYLQRKEMLKSDITDTMKNKFKDITDKNTDVYNKRIDTIVSWIDENPSRGEIINRLVKLHVKDNNVESIADLLKYTYFIHAKWSIGDIFNMAIGQGEHKYTPVQMARYISAVANGGNLHKLSLIKDLIDKKTGTSTSVPTETERINISNPDNFKYIQQGMADVSDEGTAKAIFSKFPIKVAAKTGTAETQGKIPTKDEVNYYLSHLGYYNVDKQEVLALSKKLKDKSKYNYKDEYYIKSAIRTLNPRLSIDDLDRFKETYADYSWFVAYAPYDKPKIAVVTLLFQGGSGGHAGPATRDVIAQYMGLNKDEVKLNDEKDDLKIKLEQNKNNTSQTKTYTFNEDQHQDIYNIPKKTIEPPLEKPIPLPKPKPTPPPKPVVNQEPATNPDAVPKTDEQATPSDVDNTQPNAEENNQDDPEKEDSVIF